MIIITKIRSSITGKRYNRDLTFYESILAEYIRNHLKDLDLGANIKIRR